MFIRSFLALIIAYAAIASGLFFLQATVDIRQSNYSQSSIQRLNQRGCDRVNRPTDCEPS